MPSKFIQLVEKYEKIPDKYSQTAIDLLTLINGSQFDAQELTEAWNDADVDKIFKYFDHKPAETIKLIKAILNKDLVDNLPDSFSITLPNNTGDSVASFTVVELPDKNQGTLYKDADLKRAVVAGNAIAAENELELYFKPGLEFSGQADINYFVTSDIDENSDTVTGSIDIELRDDTPMNYNGPKMENALDKLQKAGAQRGVEFKELADKLIKALEEAPSSNVSSRMRR